MKIKLIDFGVREDWRPYRPHGNDAGADVYMPYDCTLKPGDVEKVPLGFGIEVPDGYAGYVFPRSSMAARGLVCELPPRPSENFNFLWSTSFFCIKNARYISLEINI